MVTFLFSTFNTRERKHVTILTFTHIIKKRSIRGFGSHPEAVPQRLHLALMAMATVDYLKEYRGLLRNISGCSVVMSAAGNAIVHPITGHEDPEGE